MTAQELITEVATIVGDTSTTFQQKLLQGLRRALRRIPAFLYDDKILTVYSSQITAGNNTLELPAYVMQVKTIMIYAGQRWLSLKRVKLEDLKVNSNNGRPSEFAMSKHTIHFDRAADQDYYLRIICYQQDLSSLSLTTELDFTDDVYQLLSDALLYEAYMYRERPDLANAALGAFKAQLDAVLQMYSEDNVGSIIWDE